VNRKTVSPGRGRGESACCNLITCCRKCDRSRARDGETSCRASCRRDSHGACKVVGRARALARDSHSNMSRPSRTNADTGSVGNHTITANMDDIRTGNDGGKTRGCKVNLVTCVTALGHSRRVNCVCDRRVGS
jgi:hypothetical protein